MNTACLLVNSASKYPDKTAIISEDTRHSYKTFNERVNRLAHAKRGCGLKKGDRDALIIGPHYHTAALNNYFTVQVALGGTSLLIRKFDPELVLPYIDKEKENVISGSPAMFNLLLQYPRLDITL
jgi:acyl-CoA synthetase (AMP-forming)/AMP-acid ligase II